MADFVLGNLVWKVAGDTRDFDKGLDKAGKRAKGFGGGLKKAFLGVGAVLATIGIGKLSKDLVKAASDAEEVQNKFDVVFGSVKNNADLLANELAEGYGLASSKSKSLLADTADLLQGFGIGSEASLELSGNVNKLAVDLASFTNFAGGAEGASQALTKALLGETESAKALGIAITQAELKTLAEEQGLVFKELTRGEKALLTYDLAVRQSQNAIGDFARSQNSFANQSRIAQSRIEDIQVILGQGLLPIANVGVTLFNDFAKKLIDTAQAVRDFATSARGAELIGDIFGKIAGVVSVTKDIITELFDVFGDVLGEITEPFQKLRDETGNTGIAFTILGGVVTSLSGGFRIVGKIIGGTIDNIVNLGLAVRDVGSLVGGFVGLLTREVTLEEFGERIDKVGESFKQFGLGLIDNTKDIITETASLIGTFGEDSQAAADKFRDGFEKASDSISTKVTKALRDAEEGQKGLNKETEGTLRLREREEELAKQRSANEQTRRDEQAQRAEAYKEELVVIDELKKEQDAEEAERLAFLEAARRQQFETGLQDAIAFFGALSSLSQQFTANRIAEIDEELQRELEAKGLAEATTLEKLQTELQAAIDAGDSETEEEKRIAIERQKLIEKAERDKAKAQYKGDLVAWGLNKLTAAANGIVAITKATTALPWPLNLPLIVGQGLVNAAQFAAIQAAKPKPPAFQGGGIVPQVPGVPSRGDAQLARVNPGELILNDTQQKNLFDMLNVGSGGRQPVTINQYNTLNTDTLSNLQRAARVLFPALQTEGLRRG